VSEDDAASERPSDPTQRAREKADYFRLHAELAAVFEGCRKFDAELRTDLSPDTARDVQRTIAKLEKSRPPEAPLIPPEQAPEATRLLTLDLSTNNYHVYRRPGEVMIVRLLAGDEVDTFYGRLQAHFDAALAGCREDEREAHGWKQNDKVNAYLAALDEITDKLEDRYLREAVRKLGITVLSTQTADEINISFLADHLMGVPIPELVGAASAPPDEPEESDLAWFFKLFALRGLVDGVERMCFFTFLQKADEGW